MTACSLDGCDRPVNRRGLCKAHYTAALQAEGARCCMVSGCDRPHYGRGYCQRHYARWRKHGDPAVVTLPSERRQRAPQRIEDRFWPKVNRATPDGCWQWLGFIGPNGYGHFAVVAQRGKETYADAHRVAYELLVGPIPGGLVLDHLCSNRVCVNPAHLEPVTQAENVRRARERIAGIGRLLHTQAPAGSLA